MSVAYSLSLSLFLSMAIPMDSMIFALSLLFFISAAFSISESPFIVAHKKATLTNLQSGIDRVSVSIDVYNRGSASAFDVSLTDNSWGHEVFDIVSGNYTKTWERLDAGSHVSHSFELMSQVKTRHFGAPAVITFRVPKNAKLQEAYSTPILPLDILADKTAEQKFEWRFVTKYGSLISVICIVTLSGHLITSPSKSSDGKGNKKRR
ncbi:uncharacterized protein LOC131312002 isoform X2 [Rhododendron vialii]|uniref:uncharacterized protein LOC131312002 isoform X2 n=1 Tax=Rhododendron vialii TaxID=182163 RepID=UPI00265FD8D7|nr:uncharacterized protein LOC131312002 isoform X2 [Rhododendron vialii]